MPATKLPFGDRSPVSTRISHARLAKACKDHRPSVGDEYLPARLRTYIVGNQPVVLDVGLELCARDIALVSSLRGSMAAGYSLRLSYELLFPAVPLRCCHCSHFIQFDAAVVIGHEAIERDRCVMFMSSPQGSPGQRDSLGRVHCSIPNLRLDSEFRGGRFFASLPPA